MNLDNHVEKGNHDDKYTAVLLGCAIGDMLGAPVEMWNRDEIQKYYGKISGAIAPKYFRMKNGEILLLDEVDQLKQNYVMPKYGEYTDDTILTIAIAESIASNKCIDIDDIAGRHVTEYFSRKLPDGRVAGGFGGTTRDALMNLKNGMSAKDSGVKGPGAGPAMKMSPIGIYAHLKKDESMLKYAKDVSRMTHIDTRSVAGGIVQAHAIYSLLNGIDRNGFIRYVAKICEDVEEEPSKDVAAPDTTLKGKISWIEHNRDASVDEALIAIGNGGAAFESHPFALFMFQKYWNDSLNGLIETINWGGDSDTTGAIYGSLMGAKEGMIFSEQLYNPLGKIEVDRLFSLGRKLSGGH